MYAKIYIYILSFRKKSYRSFSHSFSSTFSPLVRISPRITYISQSRIWLALLSAPQINQFRTPKTIRNSRRNFIEKDQRKIFSACLKLQVLICDCDFNGWMIFAIVFLIKTGGTVPQSLAVWRHAFRSSFSAVFLYFASRGVMVDPRKIVRGRGHVELCYLLMLS